MASINKVILVGNLGQDPDSRCTPNGTQVTRISLAANDKWKDKKTGQTQVKTEWHNVVMYNKLAEIGATLLKKGMNIYVEGSLSTNKWKDKSGQDRQTTTVVASEMQVLHTKDEEKPKDAAPATAGQPIKYVNVCKAAKSSVDPTLNYQWDGHGLEKAPSEDDDLPF